MVASMAPEQKSKRWLPRWSVRILLIAITLICAYLACWGPTKNQGVSDVAVFQPGRRSMLEGTWIDVSAIVPFVVRKDHRYKATRSYYFWFFGYVAKLPYEKELPKEQHHLDWLIDMFPESEPLKPIIER